MTTSKNNSANRTRKGDTSRTSNNGQKLSSGGRKETDNKGRHDSDIVENPSAIKGKGRKM